MCVLCPFSLQINFCFLGFGFQFNYFGCGATLIAMLCGAIYFLHLWSNFRVIFSCYYFHGSLYEVSCSLLTFSSLPSQKEKAPYEAKAAKRKAEYEKQMKAYNKKQVCLACHF